MDKREVAVCGFYNKSCKVMFEFKAKGIRATEIEGKDYLRIDQGGVSAIYPWENLPEPHGIKYLLMDLDGTSAMSEKFWIYIISLTTATLLGDGSFSLKEEDAPYVQGFTTLAHLEYCKKKYGFKQSLDEANALYHKIAKEELDKAMKGVGVEHAFVPRPGLKDFLLKAKGKGIKIGLATSGLEYKAVPEIVSVFRELGMGDPLSFYDATITGGKRKSGAGYGTMGELCAKPHPWVYRELALGLGVEDFSTAVALEDSSSGVISAHLAGLNVIGLDDGNLIESGFDKGCYKMVSSLDEVWELLNK